MPGTAVDTDNRDLAEMNSYHEDRIAALTRVIRDQQRELDDLNRYIAILLEVIP